MKRFLAAVAIFLSAANLLRADLATRNARYWMNHVTAVPQFPECATLQSAIISNGSQLDLGFIILPLKDEEGNGELDSYDTMVEALGLYWRGRSYFRPLNDKISPALVCPRRRQLAVELIAATANTVLLGTSPTNFVESGDTPFPADLVDQAREAARGDHPEQMAAFTARLRQFNHSGLTNEFGQGLYECWQEWQKGLRQASQNPTTKANCRAHD